MKKILTLLSFVLFCSFGVQAQQDNEAMQREMDMMMQQMQEMMKGFGEWMGEAPVILDTTIIREFHFPADELNNAMEQFPTEDLTNMMFRFSPDSLMNSDMFKGMEEMMEQWSNQDMSDMEEFFKDLEKLMPALPEFEEQNPSDGKVAPRKKKRKGTITL